MLMGSGAIYDKVYRVARELALTKEPRILPKDQIPVVFCQVSEWEGILTTTTTEGLSFAIKAAATEKYDGWMLSSIPMPEVLRKRYRYPFRDLNAVVPWWHNFRSRLDLSKDA
ncbi:hypothetical protein H8M03_04460 [Sphingomonas sabuli]|uniref:Uncharacterized protein n=1 Tax=Sphingomonas sabuli TaxID=2764186 RepID=A0A7G9L4N7_9SPHN|nr:hypothetical protein [Sphingomonas sabuli]QNM83586.1 hypothetical protein H8M03_04460 [Sphingomonas sabuli]